MRRYIDMMGPRDPETVQPRPLPKAHFVPSILRTRARGAHLEPVGQHDDDAKIPEFPRRQGVTSLATAPS